MKQIIIVTGNVLVGGNLLLGEGGHLYFTENSPIGFRELGYSKEEFFNDSQVLSEPFALKYEDDLVLENVQMFVTGRFYVYGSAGVKHAYSQFCAYRQVSPTELSEFLEKAKQAPDQFTVESKEGQVIEQGGFIKFSDGTYIDLDPTEGLTPAFKLTDGDKVTVTVQSRKP